MSEAIEYFKNLQKQSENKKIRLMPRMKVAGFNSLERAIANNTYQAEKRVDIKKRVEQLLRFIRR